jgi:CBS domain-containing protein
LAADGALLGVIDAADLEQSLAGETSNLTAASLVHAAHGLHADQTLEQAARALAATDDEGLPVLDVDDDVIGWLTHRRLLRAYGANLDAH